jgi:hypothetical protein
VFRVDAARAGAAVEVEPLVDERPDLNMVVYNPVTPADTEKIKSIIASAKP